MIRRKLALEREHLLPPDLKRAVFAGAGSILLDAAALREAARMALRSDPLVFMERIAEN